MKLGQLKTLINAVAVTACSDEREITSGCACDLLSWVMAHGCGDMAWVTVQTHMNVIAVAALLDFALRVLLGSVPGLGIDYDVLLCPLVTAWYLLTELGSIAENAGALGAPMPQFLMRAIAALRAGISDRGGGDGNGGGAA